MLGGKGSVTKMDADARALEEYEAFAVRRRALLEAEGERLQTQALEAAVAELGSNAKAPRKTKKRSPPKP